jgi:peroxiredoxin
MATAAALVLAVSGWWPGVTMVRAQSESRFVPWDPGATPALELRDVAGQPHRLTDYRGQLVLVNFWATWCEFCKDEVASLRTLKTALAGRPLAILLVNYGESPTRVREYARHLSLAAPVLLDPTQDVARAWRVRVVPSSFVIDADGRPRYTVIGTLDWGGEEAVATIRGLVP